MQLDTTLAELYREHGIPEPFTVTTHCVFGHLDLHPEFPRELVYPEDEEPVPYSDDAQEQARLRGIILGLKPLRRAFGVGDMDVIFFGPNVQLDRVERDLAQLPPNQRHRVRIIDLNQGNVLARLRDVIRDRTVIFWRPQGWMQDFACLIDPQTAYDINSKDYLITSGIRTPPSCITSLDDIGPESVFATRPLPFVVKLFRASCGFGTFLVTSEERRREMLAAMPKYKSRGTTSVIVSEYIDFALEVSVHFIVGAAADREKRNSPQIMGVTEQTLSESGKWIGARINYQAQTDLQDLVRETVLDTARRLPEEFVGWAGFELLIDKDARQWVVDLNARFTGSMPVCLMSGHFWKERGLPFAQFGIFEYSGDTRSIYCRLASMLETGEVVITATAAIDKELNMAEVVWGGKNEKNLARVRDLIEEKIR